MIRNPEITKKNRTPRLPVSIRQSWLSHGAEPLDERCQAMTIAIDSARMPSRQGMRCDECGARADSRWDGAGILPDAEAEPALPDRRGTGINDIARIFIALPPADSNHSRKQRVAVTGSLQEGIP